MANFQVTGSALDGFKILGNVLEENRPFVLKQIGILGTDAAKQSFRNAADPDGRRPWLPLAPATAKWKEKHGYSNLPLTRKGFLRRSIHWDIATRNSVHIGTNMEYGPHHQFGAPRAGVPKRPFLGLGQPEVKTIQSICTKYINQAGQRAARGAHGGS